jgi:serine/threonine-protein kinase
VQTGVSLKNQSRTHKILQCVAETVADMHAGILCDRPIVHNDLKSMNVLAPIASPAEGILIDFSHSYFAGNLPPFITDKRENPMGTAKYMAPEKWDDDYTNGFKSDVFAFGVMAYYACTGKHPFDGDTAQIRKQIQEVTPPSPIQLGFDVLRNISAIIMSCLEKKPEQRPTMEFVAQCYADAVSLLK